MHVRESLESVPVKCDCGWVIKKSIHPPLSLLVVRDVFAFSFLQAGPHIDEPAHDCVVRLREDNMALRGSNRMLLDRCAHLEAGADEDHAEIYRFSQNLKQIRTITALLE